MKISCRACGSVLPPAKVELAVSRGYCERCERWFPLNAAHVAVELPAVASPRPAASRVEFVVTEATLGLIIPGGNNPTLRNLLAAAAVLIDAIATVAALSALLPATRENVSSTGAGMLVLVALAVTLAALFFARGEFTLSIDRRQCTLIWRLYRWNWTQNIPTAEITGVVERVIYTSNGQPRFAIALQHPSRRIVFGGTLSNEERRWIADELRRFLRLDVPAHEPVDA